MTLRTFSVRPALAAASMIAVAGLALAGCSDDGATVREQDGGSESGSESGSEDSESPSPTSS